MKKVTGMVALIMAAGSSAAASMPDSDGLSSLLPLTLDELIATPVITASRHRERRDSTPAHIMVFTREQIRDRRYQSLADLLEDLPGVDFQRGTRSGLFNHFAFQGHLSNNKLLILLDGVRIDHPVGGKIPVADNFSLHFARQVEVLYGPAAALYGADAFAGVINIITQRPAEGNSGQVALAGGSWDSRRVEFLAHSELLGGWVLTASAHDMQSDRAPLDDYFPGVFKPKPTPFGSRTEYTEGYRGDIEGESQFLRLNHGADFTLGYYRNRFRNLTSNGDQSGFADYLSGAYIDTTIETLYAQYAFDLGDALRAELVADHSVYELDPRSNYANGYTHYGENGYVYARARRSGIEQNLTWQFNADHTLQASVAYRRYRSLFTPDLSAPYDRSEGPSGQNINYPGTDLPISIFDSGYSSWSAYLQWQARWTETFSTMVGARHDRYSSYGASFNPRMGAIWRVSPSSLLKLLYGESFRIPSTDEVYSAYGTFDQAPVDGVYQGVGFRTPNENLQPEDARSLSLTWDWRPRPDFNLVVNGYYTEVEHVITTQYGVGNAACPFDAALLQASNQYIPGAVLCDVSMKMNAGEDRYWGVDVIPQWKTWLGSGWSVDVWGNYSFVRGLSRERSEDIWREQVNLARHKLKAGATFRYNDWLTLTPKLRWIGPTTTGAMRSAASAERFKTDAYRLVDLHLGLHDLADSGLSLYFDIYNLMDERYYAAHTSAASIVLLEVPQQPRTFMGTLEYRF